MTKELIERLYASDVASALTNEAARAIEALQARVADQSAQLTRHTNLIDQLQEERCKLAARVAELETACDLARTAANFLSAERDIIAAELAAARAQEPVSYRYKFTHPISGEPVWRDSSPTWNGQCVQEVQPLFAAPVPPVREPVAWRWRMNGQWHYGPEPLFKDGFTTQEPLYDKPIPPVREPLSDAQINEIRLVHGVTSSGRGIREVAQVISFARAIEAITKEQK